VVERFHPGPIDNSSLRGEIGDELKKGLVERIDFVLLPRAVGDLLHSKYRGGPRFPRKAVKFGSHLINVDLYPVRFEISHCDQGSPRPWSKFPSRGIKSSSHFIIRYYNANMIFDRVIDDAKGMFRVECLSSVRCWIKDGHHSLENAAKRQRTGRLLTAEQVERDNDWKYLPDAGSKRVADLLKDSNYVEIILETVRGKNPSPSEWPRYSYLQSWKKGLRKGDFIDAKDHSGHWYEALVTDIDNTGKVTVHFLAWGKEFDEAISPEEKSTRIAPWHDETADRTVWTVGDWVELKVSSTTPIRWIPAFIISADSLNSRIQVRYSVHNKEEIAVETVAIDGVKPQVTFIDEDDMAKEWHDLYKWHDPYDDEAQVTHIEEDDIVFSDEWHDLYGDEICPIFTHCSKQQFRASESQMASMKIGSRRKLFDPLSETAVSANRMVVSEEKEKALASLEKKNLELQASLTNKNRDISMFKESVQEYKTRYIIAEETAEIELNERDLEVVRLRTEFDQYRENQPHFKETQREIDGLQTVEACEAWKVDVEKVLRSIEQKKVNSIFSLLQTMA
jgi:hypothetical protein